MKLHLLRFLFVLALGSFFSGCYTLSGVSIDPNVRTYFVGRFKTNATNAPPALDQTFTEALKEKIRTESRLVFTDTDPDVEFVGTIVDYRISSEAPQPGETTALNRLTITTAIEYIEHKNPDKKGWKNNFSFFYDFPSSTNLSSIQEDAIQTISNQMMEDIFNKAFTDW